MLRPVLLAVFCAIANIASADIGLDIGLDYQGSSDGVGKNVRLPLASAQIHSTAPLPSGVMLGYDDNGVTAVGAANAMPVVLADDGDVNLDGAADLDLTIWRANFGTTSGADWTTGDVNNDGAVDYQDLTAWTTDVGMTYPVGSAILAGFGGVSPVPEPGTIALLASGLFGLLAYAWRKRK